MLTSIAWIALTLIPLAFLKWLRWHFISRRFLDIPAKKSFLLYIFFLPASFHPLIYLLELLKIPFLQKEFPQSTKKITKIWLIEKINELSTILIIINFANSLIVVTGLFSLITFNLVFFKFQKNTTGYTLNPIATSLLIASQSLIISYILSLILPYQTIALAITIIFSLSLIAIKYSQIKNFFKPYHQDHFTDIANLYEDDIKAPSRNKLLKRKIAIMQSSLPKNPLKGLDIGCGQGWYAIEMAKLGHKIEAIDPAKGQIQKCQENNKQKDLYLHFQVAGAEKLPYPDNTFDFAYSINVFHHILNQEDRSRAFDEVIRVLKPGGTFFLHEINIENPLFRFYMCYIFALIRNIDEGNERFIKPSKLPNIPNGKWQKNTDFFTFLPDFAPQFILNWFAPIEKWLEKSKIKSWSAHYTARLIKNSQ